MIYNLKLRRGVSTIELLVAMSLFVLLISIASDAFIRALRTQRMVVSLLEANNNASLALEQMVREMRTGSDFTNISNSEIRFVNGGGDVVLYRLDGGVLLRGIENVLMERVYKKITADSIQVTRLRFSLVGEQAGDGSPPRITIIMSVSVKSKYLEGVSMNLQTTVSARNIDT